MNGIHDKIKALRNQKAALAAQIEGAPDAAALRAIRDQLIDINGQIGDCEILLTELGEGAQPLRLSDSEAVADKSLHDRLASNEYTRAFFDAMTSNVARKDARKDERYHILLDALTENGGDPAGSEGGFLLPIEFDNMIWELRRNSVALLDFVTVEDVTAASGWRAVPAKAATARFNKLVELDELPKADAPKFAQVAYTISEYGGTLPVSAALMEDTPVNIMRYLSRWMAQMSVNTENAAILAKMDALTAKPWAATDKDATLRSALNKGIDTAHAQRAVIITNQDGFDALDGMADANGRPLLQPNPTDETQMRYKGRAIVALPNWQWPSTTTYPFYVGDFAEYLDFFRRKSFEVASTDVGAGTFERRAVMVRGIQRFDAQVIDAKAAVRLGYTPAAA